MAQTKVDLQKFMGLWHEVARLPHSFERSCIQITSEYTLKKDGKINITNRCIKENGHKRSAHGEVKIVDKTNNAKMEVEFAPDWLKWSGIGKEDYWIIDIDPQYKWAVISEPNRDFLWILSRMPVLDSKIYDNIINKLENWDFDLSHLVVSKRQIASS